jgi:hypothetical protein
MDKILVDFNQIDFDNALNKFKQKEDAFLKIGLITESLGLFIRPDETDYREAILKAVAEKYKKQNTLNLTPEKLIHLKEIDLKEYYSCVDVYESLKHLQEPDKEKYSTYITTEAQKERWEVANELKNAFDKAKAVAPFIKPESFIARLHPMFTFSNGSLRIYTYYILNG